MGRAVAQSVRFRLQSHLANRMEEEAPNQLNLRALPHRGRPPDRPARRAPTDYSERPRVLPRLPSNALTVRRARSTDRVPLPPVDYPTPYGAELLPRRLVPSQHCCVSSAIPRGRFGRCGAQSQIARAGSMKVAES
jgi:hypothetical protein